MPFIIEYYWDEDILEEQKTEARAIELALVKRELI